jgi:hypothetical protein
MGFEPVFANPSPIKTEDGALSLAQTKEILDHLKNTKPKDTGKKPHTGGVKRSIRRKRKVARTKKRTVTLSEKRK